MPAYRRDGKPVADTRAELERRTIITRVKANGKWDKGIVSSEVRVRRLPTVLPATLLCLDRWRLCRQRRAVAGGRFSLR